VGREMTANVVCLNSRRQAVAKQPTHVSFVVEYEDGRTSSITIDQYTLRTGDHVARIVAREWQDAGRIPAGKIKSVRRGFGG
jgi:hypothetical protein